MFLSGRWRKSCRTWCGARRRIALCWAAFRRKRRWLPRSCAAAFCASAAPEPPQLLVLLEDISPMPFHWFKRNADTNGTTCYQFLCKAFSELSLMLKLSVPLKHMSQLVQESLCRLPKFREICKSRACWFLVRLLHARGVAYACGTCAAWYLVSWTCRACPHVCSRLGVCDANRYSNKRWMRGFKIFSQDLNYQRYESPKISPLLAKGT